MAVNPILEGGFFFIILVTAFGLMLYAFKAQNGKGMMRMISMALFCILAIFVGAGYEVAFSSSTTNVQTNETWTAEDVILPGGTDSNWYGWLFSGFAMADIMFILKDYQGGT